MPLPITTSLKPVEHALLPPCPSEDAARNQSSNLPRILQMTRRIALSLLALTPVAALLFQPPQPVNAQADTITGKVIFSGPKPVVKKILMDANITCAKLHPNGVPSQEVILNAD